MYYLAASNSSTADKAFANAVCDGTNDDVEIQAALDGYSYVTLLPGLYTISQVLQHPTDTVLDGTDPALTTITAKDAFNPALSGTLQGPSVVGHKLGTTPQNVVLRNVTIDHNAGYWDPTNMTSVSSGASTNSYGKAHAVAYFNCTGIHIENVWVRNAMKYSIQLQNCYDFTVERCSIISGALTQSAAAYPFYPSEWATVPSNPVWKEQDGIHINGSQRGLINRNFIDTGEYNGGGDDAIALLCYHDLPDNANIIISENVIESGHHGVSMYGQSGASGGKKCVSVQVVNNTFFRTVYSAVRVSYQFGTQDANTIANNIKINENLIFQPLEQYGSPSSAGRGVIDIQDHLTTNGTVDTGLDSYQGLSISDNICDATGMYASASSTNPLYFIRAYSGTGLVVQGNQVRNWDGWHGVFLAEGHEFVNVSMNALDLSGGKSGAHGIHGQGIRDGVISGNTIGGLTSGSSIGIWLEGLASWLARYNSIVSNRVRNFATGFAETSGGGNAYPNYVSGNTFYGCTTSIALQSGSTSEATNNSGVS